MNSFDIVFFILFALSGFGIFAVVRFAILLVGGVAGGGGGQDTRARDLLILTAVTVVVTGCVGFWLGGSAAIGALVGSGLAALWLVPKMRSGRGGR
jgi:hypothetical protein